jgi:hypothetical protein
MPIGEAIRARSLRRGATYRRLSSVTSFAIGKRWHWRAAPAVRVNPLMAGPFYTTSAGPRTSTQRTCATQCGDERALNAALKRVGEPSEIVGAASC